MKNIYLFTGDPDIQYIHLKKLFPNNALPYNIIVNDYDRTTKEGHIVVFGETSKNINTYIPKENRMIILGECSSIRTYKKCYLNQFGKVIGAHSAVHPKDKQAPGHGWFYENSLSELEVMAPFPKPLDLSIISSNKTFTPGHKRRLDFCRQLARDLNCEEHFYGRGIKNFESKWSALKNYKYTIAIENSCENHWITEKLTDSFLSHTFPFYYGAPNVSDYYPEHCFIQINLNDYTSTRKLIEATLNNENHYFEHQKYLIEARLLYLQKYIFTKHIDRFHTDNILQQSLSSIDIIHKDPGEHIVDKLIRRAQNIVFSMGNKSVLN